jgi:hypothetical protein
MSKPTITDRSEATGMVGQPSLSELSESIQFVVPSEDRDFFRPRDSYYAQTPPDVAMSDDGQNWVRQVQKVMKGNPISPPYPGPIDGKINRKLLDVLLNFSWTLKRKTGKQFNIVSGNSINQGELTKALIALKEFLHPKPQKEEKIEEDKSDETVLAFQKFFSTAQPVIGVLYNGPQDGKLNDDLIAAAKRAEIKISNAVGQQGAQGMIWGGSGFGTSTEDVSSALGIITKNKKVAFFTSEERIRIFSSILCK